MNPSDRVSNELRLLNYCTAARKSPSTECSAYVRTAQRLRPKFLLEGKEMGSHLYILYLCDELLSFALQRRGDPAQPLRHRRIM